MTLELIVFYVFMFILGSIFGSFACCQAWRLHERPKKLGSRSICMHCKKKLKWYDNLPIISWLILRGKCRNCGKKIGVMEILAEISLGLVFLAFSFYFTGNSLDSLTFIPLISLLILLVSMIIFWVLLVFDAKWGELPVSLMLVEIVLGVLYQFINSGDWLKIGMAVGILAGIYYLLYLFSKEKWVGGGDWILCISIAIFLGNPMLAIIELSLSNTLALVYAVPSTILKKDKHVPFGPFLILALVIILLLKSYIEPYLVLFY